MRPFECVAKGLNGRFLAAEVSAVNAGEIVVFADEPHHLRLSGAYEFAHSLENTIENPEGHARPLCRFTSQYLKCNMLRTAGFTLFKRNFNTQAASLKRGDGSSWPFESPDQVGIGVKILDNEIGERRHRSYYRLTKNTATSANRFGAALTLRWPARKYRRSTTSFSTCTNASKSCTVRK